MGSIKINEYHAFEQIRPGLLTAIRELLYPVLISPCNKDVDILVVQCQVNELKIRVINGYGPQEDEPIATRLTFWASLEQEIISAKDTK